MEKEKNKVIAFIPARGGSKGIKDKNIVDLDGIPLVMWSVFAAATSKKVDQIFVSSDSDEILNLVNIYERRIDKDIKLLKRHQDLSEDLSTTESVIDDFIHNYQDIISRLRDAESAAPAALAAAPAPAALAVAPAPAAPAALAAATPSTTIKLPPGLDKQIGGQIAQLVKNAVVEAQKKLVEDGFVSAG